MAAFSRCPFPGVAFVAALSLGGIGGCGGTTDGTGPAERVEAALPAPRQRIPAPVDPGSEEQSRNLLQHYIARDVAHDRLALGRGRQLELEADSWELPFKSKRMVAALLTVAARDDLEDLRSVLSHDATWGEPDARRPNERPIFEGDEGDEFLDAFRVAAARFDERAMYRNPTNFMMGIQEHLRSGAEPMWSYYEDGYDRILFRFITRGGKARITYVGLYREGEVPTEPRKLDSMGPPSLMSPPVRKESGEVVVGRPKRAGVRSRSPG